MPMLRLEGSPLHSAMADHFDLVWDTASVSGTAWLDTNQVGIDTGAQQTGAVNVFTGSGTGYNRMCWLIEHAQERVWLQGISLRSFFEPGKLYAALRGAMRRDDVDVRILLLDPDCEQARYRSYREPEFSDHRGAEYGSFAEYTAAESCHADSTLARDTHTTINKIRRSIGTHAEAVRLYRSAPACFVLMVDDEVLVEQYHFGKAVPPELRVEDQGTPPILGKDMALVEFTKEPSVLVEQDPSRHPYDLLESHLLFVHDHCSSRLTNTTAPEPA
ncbi:MAG TPA: hypothetical protein VGJ86_05905 [Acidimicrobiales bacterium]